MRIGILAVTVILMLGVPMAGQAASKMFIEEYTYRAGEADSKLTCRTVSLIEVKRLLLERLGTFMQTETVVRDFEVTRDDIVTVSAGVVKTEILEERWTGETYSLIAKIEADPDAVARALTSFQKQQGSKQSVRRLDDINAESLEQMRELQARMGQLQSNLIKVNQDVQAHQGLLDAWGMYEKGVQLRQAGKPEAAIAALNAAIQSNPTQLAYFQRGKAQIELKRYNAAVQDFTRALELEPDMRGALFGRGKANWELGRKRKARLDMKRAAKLGNPQARKWLKRRGSLFGK